jgi:hypothetical protein
MCSFDPADNYKALQQSHWAIDPQSSMQLSPNFVSISVINRAII